MAANFLIGATLAVDPSLPPNSTLIINLSLLKEIILSYMHVIYHRLGIVETFIIYSTLSYIV